MRSRFLSGMTLAVVLLNGGFASASKLHPRKHAWWAECTTSMYYPWAGIFPWNRPGTVNPDVISDSLLSSSEHWPALSDYAFYDSTFGPSRHQRYALGRCPDRQH